MTDFIKYIPGALAILAVLCLGLWLGGTRPGVKLELRVPGTDRPVGGEKVEVAASVPPPRLEKFDGVPSDLPGEWPGFRGKMRDGIAREESGLTVNWPAGGPKVLWSVGLGEGYAGAAVRGGRVYVLDYDKAEKRDALRCFSLADGKEIWRYSYHVVVKRNHGMSRTVATVTEKHVVSLGPKCHVTCVDCITGEFQWGLDLVGEFKAKVPLWYAGQCPLVEGDRVILATGGPELMIAVDIATGAIVWKTPNPHAWVMTHSSIAPMEIGGKRTYVYTASGGVAAVSAEDGALLWETDLWKISEAAIASPVHLGGGRIFLSGGYGAGAMFLELEEKEGRFTPRMDLRLEPEAFGSPQQTPVFFEGHLYGVRPDGQLVCMDPRGKIIWTSGPTNTFGYGPYLIASGLIFAMNDEGQLTLAKAAPERYEELAEAKVLSGHESWAPMAIADGRLLVRDFTRMVCLEVKEGR